MDKSTNRAAFASKLTMIDRGYIKGAGFPPIKRPLLASYRRPKHDIQFKGFAEALYSAIPNPKSVSLGAFSLEDLTNRLMTWTIYMPQGYLAIKHKTNPYETWGRNMLVWTGSVIVTFLAKHPKFGFNRGLNAFMVPRKTGEPMNIIERFLINPLRPSYNYLEKMNEAGINLGLSPEKLKDLGKAVLEKPYWTAPDLNELRLLANQAKVVAGEESKLFTSVVHRITLFNYLSVLASSVLMAVMLGVLLQSFVIKFISPLDKKFVSKGKEKPKPIEIQPKTPLPPQMAGYPLAQQQAYTYQPYNYAYYGQMQPQQGRPY